MQDAKFKMQTLKSAGAGKLAAFAFCILHFAFIVTGCAKTQAASVPDGPPLAVPAPPPRVIAPAADTPLAENPPVPEPAATPPPTPARPATPPRRQPTTATTAAEEPKPAEPPVTPPASTEAPVVRPVPTQVDAAAERKVRDDMRKAATDLQRVDYQKLSANGKLQYEAAKRFLEQAEQELKDRNYAFAKTVADKAVLIATELQSR
jgi:outer membrane biosynthesis protein TonB